MSLIVSNPIQIHNSPINTSPTKQLFSFSRSSRFTSRAQSQCDQIYDIPSTIEKRSAGIGYGTKYDFQQNLVSSPAPNTYIIKTDIDTQKEKNQGWSIGLGRDQLWTQGIFARSNSQSSLPGPGNYKATSQLSTIKFSMRPKTKIKTPQEIQNIPGPGTYQEVPAINKYLKYPISKYKNYGQTLFNPSSSARFKTSRESEFIPGPGQYKNSGIHPEGKYFNSKHECSHVRTFSRGQRITFKSQNNSPGPGSYRMPSCFGYYESARLHKKQ